MRLHFLFWHFKSSCRGIKRNLTVFVKIIDKRICTDQPLQHGRWVCLPFSRKDGTCSHFTPLLLHLQIQITEFPMEKTFLVFSQLVCHKARAPLFAPVLNFIKTGSVLLTGQHKWWSCCRDATRPCKRGEVLRRTILVTSSRFSAPKQWERRCNTILCVTSLFLGCKWQETRPLNKLSICYSYCGKQKPKYSSHH